MTATTSEQLDYSNTYNYGESIEYGPGRWWKCHKRGSRVDTRKTINALAVVHNSILTSTKLLGDEQQELLNALKAMYGEVKTESTQPSPAPRRVQIPFLVECDLDASFVYV